MVLINTIGKYDRHLCWMEMECNILWLLVPDTSISLFSVQRLHNTAHHDLGSWYTIHPPRRKDDPECITGSAFTLAAADIKHELLRRCAWSVSRRGWRRQRSLLESHCISLIIGQVWVWLSTLLTWEEIHGYTSKLFKDDANIPFGRLQENKPRSVVK